MPKRSKTKKRKIRYQVKAALNNWELAKRESAVRFEIETKDGLLGTLTVGRGSIAWSPSYGKIPFSFSWRDFADRIHRMEGRG